MEIAAHVGDSPIGDDNATRALKADEDVDAQVRARVNICGARTGCSRMYACEQE